MRHPLLLVSVLVVAASVSLAYSVGHSAAVFAWVSVALALLAGGVLLGESWARRKSDTAERESGRE